MKALLNVITVCSVTCLLLHSCSSEAERVWIASRDSVDRSLSNSTLIDPSIGPDYYELDSVSAQRLFGQLDTALEQYYNVYQQYPSATGKYFLGSVIDYIPNVYTDIAYLYTDTAEIHNTKLTPSWMSVDSLAVLDRNEQWKKHCYLGIGLPSSPILYLPPSPDRKQYLLYWVGRNKTDDLGKGDDIVYEPQS